MMKSKRSQSELITTVLIILVALAAVALVATFVINQIRSGTATAETKAKCLKVELEWGAMPTVGATTINVKRVGASDVLVKNLQASVAGGTPVTLSTNCADPVLTGSTCSYGVTALTAAQKVEVWATIYTTSTTGSGAATYTCPVTLSASAA